MPLPNGLLTNTHYDLAIIGGGINGVAIARDSAMRGMKVILFEKEDFGSGASTKTSKLAHGGLRYLEHYQFGLVKESLNERSLLLKNAPHLVTPLAFIVPVYAGDPYPLWCLKLGLYIYNHLDRKSLLPRHKNLSAEEVIHFFPTIKGEGLKGGCLFYDALMKDNRLIFENLRSAEQNGAVICNYSEVTRVLKEQDHVTGLEYRGCQQDVTGSIKARSIVNTTGAWSNQILQMNGNHEKFHVSPTKGIHLVIPQVSSQYALILRTPQDQRIFFLIPWEGQSLVGTTDTFYAGNPDDVNAEANDEEYLLNALSHYFPQISKKIISTFAGLRPLVGIEKGSPSSMSRSHEIHISPSGLVSVLGGKYTTHRRMAQEVVDTVAHRLKESSWKDCQTDQIPFVKTERQQFYQTCIHKFGLNESHASHLFAHYGENAYLILNIIKENQQESEQICSFHPHILAEIIYVIQYEYACTLEDWFFRRTSIAYSPCRGKHCIEKVSRKFGSLFRWSELTRQKAIEHYLTRVLDNSEIPM